MRCPKAFRNFGEEKTKLFANNHWWGDGKDPCILTYSPAVSTLFLITFNPESLNLWQDATQALVQIHRPSKLQDLPDSVCHTFLLTMQRANFTSLPPRSPSRLALVQKALRCLVDQVHMQWTYYYLMLLVQRVQWQQTDIYCVFAEKRLLLTNRWGCVHAWTALVSGQPFPAATHGS